MKYPIISTRDLSLLPDVATLKRITQSMSLICEVLTSQWEGMIPEYYFQTNWSSDCQAAHMDNLEGDLWHLLFYPTGAVMLGFFHEAEMSPWGPHQDEIWEGMYEGLPSEFQDILTEPAFEADEAVTFCIWRKYSDPVWQHGPIRFPFRPGDETGLVVLNQAEGIFHDYLDGSAQALSMLDGNPQRFWEWANEGHYDPDAPHDIPLAVVEAIFAHQPLTQAMVEALKPGLKLESIRDTLLETGYPLAE